MKAITSTELATRPGGIFQRVIAGESLLITVHGRGIAVISPVGGPDKRGTQPDSAGGTAGAAEVDAGTDGRAPEDLSKRNLENRTGRTAADGREAVGAGVPVDPS